MKDFVTDIYEKEICNKCKYEYLQSKFCKFCFMDTHAVEKSYTWFEDEDFIKFGIYEGINLGELIDYSFRKILFNAMSKIEKEIIFE
jgi:hypothetical protein